MSTKKLLLGPVAEKFFVSISSPLFENMPLDRSRGFALACSSVPLVSFSRGDNVRRFLKLGKRFDFRGNHGSIRSSWPIAISGSPRGHFDYKDWREYPILNIKFEDLNPAKGLAH